jgi:hypothetical protein
MANTFKSYTKSNIGTTTLDAYTVPASTIAVVIGFTLSNTTGDQITSSVLINKSDVAQDDVYLVKNIPIPNGSAFEFNAGNKIILESGDKIQITSSAATSVDAIISVLEQT